MLQVNLLMRWVLVLLAALPVMVLAQSDDDDDELSLEIAGVVEAMDATTITVDGQVYEIGTAEVYPGVEVGATIEIEFVQDANGIFRVREFTPVNDDDDMDEADDDSLFEIVGVVEAMDAETITVGGQTYSIGSAEVYAGVEVGALIEVEFNEDADGNIVVREFYPLDEDDADEYLAGRVDADDDDDVDSDFTLYGVLEAIGDGFIIVSGQQIDTSEATFEDIVAVGDRIEVDLYNIDDGLLADDIELDDDDRRDDSDDADDSGEWSSSYAIQPGDTLSGLAERTGTTVAELAQANGIDNASQIAAGTVIVVPRPPAPRPVFNDDDDDDNDDDDGPFGSNDDGSRDDDDDDESDRRDDDDDDESDRRDDDDDDESDRRDDDDDDESDRRDDDNDDDGDDDDNDDDNDDDGDDD